MISHQCKMNAEYRVYEEGTDRRSIDARTAREENMDTVKQKLKNRRLFLKRDAKLAKRLKEDYIDNGIASLPC